MTMPKMSKAKIIVGNLLTEFGMIDSLLRSIYKQSKGTEPICPGVKDDDLDKCFFDFLDSNSELYIDTKSKLYMNQDGDTIHIRDLVSKMRQVRNIAAHQTWSLITGLSSLPKETRRQAADSYVGSIDDLHAQWRFYADQFLPIFERWNNGLFDDFK